MKKILITGATGFAGKYLVDYLFRKENILFGTYLTKEDLEVGKKAKLTKIDLGDEKAVDELIIDKNPDVIFHLAASTSPRESFRDPKSTFQNNINSEINILESVKNNNLETRIVIISSAEVYGLLSKDNLPVNEEASFNPTNPYAVSKLACDYLALQYFNSSRLDTVRVRPFNHTGPGQTPNFVIPAFAKKIAEIEKGKLDKLTVGNLESKRDFTDVRDVVRAYFLISEKGKSGDVYNIGSGKSYKISEILKMLLDLSDKKIRVEEDPLLMMPSDNPDSVCDYSKLESLTGWKPEISIEQTIKETLDYWRSVV